MQRQKLSVVSATAADPVDLAVNGYIGCILGGRMGGDEKTVSNTQSPDDMKQPSNRANE